jgi:hypothetical protein
LINLISLALLAVYWLADQSTYLEWWGLNEAEFELLQGFTQPSRSASGGCLTALRLMTLNGSDVVIKAVRLEQSL